MSIKEAINDIHALTAAAIKLGADQEQDRIIGLIEGKGVVGAEAIIKLIRAKND